MKTRLMILALVLPFGLLAQDEVPATEDKSQFRLGASYSSALNYFGRTDSLRSSGLFPTAELWLNENLYLSASPVLVNNALQSFQYAGTIATAGYQFHDGEKYAGHLFFMKPFYENSSELVQSALKGQAGFNLTRLSPVINVTAGADVKWSDKLDYGLTGGLDHLVQFPAVKNWQLMIDPSAFIYAGTQQFTQTYYKKSDFILFPGFEQEITENVKQFKVLAWEFSVPVIVEKGRLRFSLTPTYVIPKNLVTVPGRPDLTERGKEMFYLQASTRIRL